MIRTLSLSVVLLSVCLQVGVSISLSASLLPAATVTVDPLQTNSIMLENFAGTSDAAAELVNGIKFVSASGGLGIYSVAAELDPKILFQGYVDDLDFATFPNVRIRHCFSSSVNMLRSGSVHPIPVIAGQMEVFPVNSTLSTSQATLGSYARLSQGLRVDPVGGKPVGGEYVIDYIFLDRGRTLGFEFDEQHSSRGGVNNFFSGMNLGDENRLEIRSTIEAGVFKGTPTNGDPMMILDLTEASGLSAIDTDIYKYIEIRMRVIEPKGGSATIFFANDSNNLIDNKIVIELAKDQYFHTYFIDLRENAIWNSDKVTKFRFDPTDRMQGFEIDYIRFYEKAAMN